MLIAHVSFTVFSDNRKSAIDALKQEIEAVRAMKGCVAFVPFTDPVNEQGVGVLHEWNTANDFAAYAASDSFANISKSLRPLMVSPPISKRFDAVMIEHIN